MPGSSTAHEAKATLLTTIVLSIVVFVTLTLFIGNLGLSLIFTWSICGAVFGEMAFNIVWHLRIRMVVAQLDASDVESSQLPFNPVLSDHTYRGTETEALTRSTACTFKHAPVYCTPLEMFNKMAVSDALDGYDVQTTFVMVVEGSEDDCTFATSPFTSPPMHTMEIFVLKEETTVYEDTFVYMPSVTPSPLVLNHDLPYVPAPRLVELIRYCEGAIAESNMRDIELL